MGRRLGVIDLDEVDRRHDAAVEIGRKYNDHPLDDKDMGKLFACASDVPNLLAHISRLEARLCGDDLLEKAIVAGTAAILGVETREADVLSSLVVHAVVRALA